MNGFIETKFDKWLPGKGESSTHFAFCDEFEVPPWVPDGLELFASESSGRISQIRPQIPEQRSQQVKEWFLVYIPKQCCFLAIFFFSVKLLFQ